MTTLESRLAKLEAPLVSKGPVLILVDDLTPEERGEQVKLARQHGLSVVFLTKKDAAL